MEESYLFKASWTTIKNDGLINDFCSDYSRYYFVKLLLSFIVTSDKLFSVFRRSRTVKIKTNLEERNYKTFLLELTKR